MRDQLRSSTAIPSESPSPPPPPLRKDDPRVAVAIADALLTAREAAALSRLSVPAFWKNVGTGRLPAPVYPALRAPRWWRSQLVAAINATACMPVENKARRRKAKLERERAAASTEA
jgi:hypothetical protein